MVPNRILFVSKVDIHKFWMAINGSIFERRTFAPEAISDKYKPGRKIARWTLRLTSVFWFSKWIYFLRSLKQSPVCFKLTCFTNSIGFSYFCKLHQNFGETLVCGLPFRCSDLKLFCLFQCFAPAIVSCHRQGRRLGILVPKTQFSAFLGLFLDLGQS